MEISVVIPTKNRKEDLFKTIMSISHQSILPKELIIIDQSNNALFENEICLINKILHDKVHTIYHYDTSISGLIEAKDFSLKLSTCNLISFLEDDVIIENNYFKEVLNGFSQKPEMKGCSGLVVNTKEKNNFYVFMHRISHLGIFKDIRPSVFKKNQKIYTKNLIRSRAISGGISTWRKDVFNHIKFDKKNGFHLLEDIDFSTRVFKFYSKDLYINPAVRLIHNSSPLGRDFDFTKNKRKAIELITFYKKNKNHKFALINIIWLLICLLGESFTNDIQLGKFNGTKGLLVGITDGYRKTLST